MAGSVSNSGISLGKLTVDKQTGLTKVGQKIEDMDLGEYFANIKEAKSIPIQKQTDTIKLNNEKLAALEDFKAKILTLTQKAAVLTNSLGYETTYGTNLLDKKNFTLASNSSIPANNILDMDIYDNAAVGSFDVQVHQIASVDRYHTQIKATTSGDPLHLNGSFIIGTLDTAATATITVTPTMSLIDITAAINAVSAKTKVTAAYNMSQSGNPSTFELSLSSSQLGLPIVLQDVMPSSPTIPASVPILQGWNLLPNQPTFLQSTSLASQTTTNLGFTGDLVIKAGSGSATTINLANLSLDDLVTQINGATSTSHVEASLVPIYPVAALSSTLPTGYALKLHSTETGQPLDLSGTTKNVLQSLHLEKAVQPSNHSLVKAADLSQDQGIAGNLVIQSGPNGAPLTLNITGLSLNDIVDRINQQTSTSRVFAKLQVINKADPQVSGSTNVCQLTLATTDGETIQFNASDPAVVSGLGLTNPVHDYQSLLSKISVNGVEYQRTGTAIYDVVKGVTLKLQTASPNTVVTVNVSKDTTAITQGIDDFVSAFNSLNDFYKQQTALKDDLSGPKEGALLTDNHYIQQFMKDLQQTVCNAVVGGPNGELISLNSIGLQLNTVSISTKGDVGVGEGNLRLNPEGGEKKLNEALQTKLDKLAALFGFTDSNTNPDFEIAAAPNVIDKSLIGKEIKLTVNCDAGGIITGSAEVNGSIYPAIVSVIGGRVSLSFENKGRPLDEFKFQYNKLPAINTSATTTRKIIPGVMAQIKGFLSQSVDNNLINKDEPSESAVFNVKGPLLQEIAVLQKKNKTINNDILRLEKNVQQDMALIEASFNKVYAARERYNQIKGILDSFNKANSR